MWWPQAVDDEEFRASLPTIQYVFEEVHNDGIGQWNALAGQFGSSTRMEIAALLIALTRNVPVRMASDSLSMINKAELLIGAAAEREEHAERRRWPLPRQLKKPWSLQTDGDLWGQVWEAVVARGAKSQALGKVKAHASEEDVVQGKVRRQDKLGNDWADDLAERGALRIGSHEAQDVDRRTRQTISIVLAQWMKQRHAAYRAFMLRIQVMIARVLQAEKQEREAKKKADAFVLGFNLTRKLG